jgi:hypothetical protein
MNPAPRLGLAEAIERLEGMPEFLRAAVDNAQPGHLALRPEPDAFSLVEHACHLRDLEREGYLSRVRRMLEEPAPALDGFDGAAVAAARDYLSQDALRAAVEFEAARREVTARLSAIGEADLRRSGTFDGEPVTLADVVAMMVEHDRGHRREIERLMEHLEGGRAWK